MLPLGVFADMPLDEVPARYCQWLVNAFPSMLDEEGKRDVLARVVGLERPDRPDGRTLEEQIVNLQFDQAVAGLDNDDPVREALTAYRDRLLKQFRNRRRGGDRVNPNPPTPSANAVRDRRSDQGHS